MKKKIGLISSFVIQGYVGLGAATPTVEILGGYPLVVPTVVYTTHAGLDGAKGESVSESIIDFSLDYLFKENLDCFVSGFLNSEYVAQKVIDYLQKNKLAAGKTKVLVDPILGDYPKGLYISSFLAQLIKDKITPLAQAITPNRFEAEFLSGREINDRYSAQETARFLHQLGPELVVITGYLIDSNQGRILDLVSYQGEQWEISCPLITDKSTSGAGDMYSAALAVLWTSGRSPELSAALSSALVNRAVFLAHQLGGGSINPIDTLTDLVPQIEGSEQQIVHFLNSLDVYLTKLF